MKRCTFLSFLIATASACASQPICKPWSPDVAPPPAIASGPTPPAAAPATLDDGTTALAGPSTDETWSTIVGDGALPPGQRAPRNSRATRSARAKSMVALAQPAVATSPAPLATPAEPARPAFGSPGYGLPEPAVAGRAIATKQVTRSAAVKAVPAVAKVAPPPAPPPKASTPPIATPPAAAAPAKPAAPPAKPVAVPEDKPTPEARAFFAGRCAMCHGEAGRGDGPAGKALTPQPRNFTDRAWQAAVTDGHIEHVILNGGPSVGKSPLMPAHGDLAGKPALLKAMRALVRELGR